MAVAPEVVTACLNRTGGKERGNQSWREGVGQSELECLSYVENKKKKRQTVTDTVLKKQKV